MEKRELNNERIERAKLELINIAEKNELTMQEFDEAAYKVRQFYNENAILKTNKE